MKLRIIMLLAAAGWAAAEDQAPPSSWRMYLSGEEAGRPVSWEFRVSAGRNAGVWTNIPVPSCWEPAGFGTFTYGHDAKKEKAESGEYRFDFRAPAEFAARRVFLVFDGVMTDADVKLNGRSAGPVHRGAFYRFRFDVTSILRYDATNRLEVAVREQSADESVNRAERQGDYWNFGGIFRPVWLEAVPAVFIDRVAIDARHDGAFAAGVTLGGDAPGADATIEMQLCDADETPVGAPVTAPAEAGRLAARFDRVRSWTAETPSLYIALFRLRRGGTVVHEVRQRFGFRTVEVRPRDGIYVNGRRIRLKGVCRHCAWPETGRAVPLDVMRADVQIIKDLNMNAVRMSHYPPDEGFLELCDEKGLYVIDELAGWQKSYSGEAGRPLIADMVRRDVNHPSILFWANGNEGGWNRALDAEFEKHDPQRRAVIHPWENFGGINTKHYPRYSELLDLLKGGDLVMPTEFLHGLYDGGHGAGLADYWDRIRTAPNGAGGFLWAFADEGVRRPDRGGAIDVNGNTAPDGLLGPHREPEGSALAVQQVWSPVQVGLTKRTGAAVTLAIENRYDFISLKDHRFVWQLRRFGTTPEIRILASGVLPEADMEPGQSGSMRFALPEAPLAAADALAVTVSDTQDRELWTWVWPLKSAAETAAALVALSPVSPPESRGGERILRGGGVEARIDPESGALLGVTAGGRPFSLTGGPVEGAAWSLGSNGWLTLEYTARPMGSNGLAGVGFRYPESRMKSKTWLGRGPFRVWRNRRVGGTYGVWETGFNRTQTGYGDWIYPEFQGYFDDVRWMKIATDEGLLTLVIPDEGGFVRVGTPVFPGAGLCKAMAMTLPDCDLAVVRDLPAIGNKFHRAEETGPRATTPLLKEPFRGILHLKFEPGSRQGPSN